MIKAVPRPTRLSEATLANRPSTRGSRKKSSVGLIQPSEKRPPTAQRINCAARHLCGVFTLGPRSYSQSRHRPFIFSAAASPPKIGTNS